MKKKISLLILLAITFLGFVIRAYKLDIYPVHLGHDEVSMLYDGISIAETGKDIYGNKYPFIFISVEDYKAPFYTYATAFSYLIFGWQEKTVRIPGVIFGVLVIPAVYFFILQLFNNRKIALFSAFFTSVAPFEIFYSRKSFENQPGIAFLLLGSGLLLYSFKNKHNKIRFISGVAISALGMYTYFSHAILIPMLLLSLIVIFRKHTSKYWLTAIFTFLLASLPLYYLIYKHPEATFRSKSVSIFQDRKIYNTLESWNIENNKIRNLAKYSLTFTASIQRFFEHLSPDYLFLNGLDLTNREYLDVGILYPYQSILLVIGIYFLFKQKEYNQQKLLIAVWLVISLLPSALTFEDRSSHRSILANSLLNIICAVGFYYLLILVNKFSKSKFIRLSFYFGSLGIFIYFLTYFLLIYTIDYPYEKSLYLQYPFKQASEYIWSNYDKYDQIIFDPKFGEDAPFIGVGAQYYIAFYGKYPPEKLQRLYKQGDTNRRESVLEKIRIRAVYWQEDKNLKNSLIIASPWSLEMGNIKQEQIIGNIKFYNNKIAFFIIEP